jgi:PPOX class probable F420-dependent enzyme
MIDFTSDFGNRANRRLSEEHIIWMITVDSRSIPQTRPVWFLWDGESILIYSRPQAYKIRHIETNPSVSLNFDSDGQGGNIVVILGEARVANSPVPDDLIERYVEKYKQGIEDLGLTPDEFSKTYSIPIRITPTVLRGH